MSRSLTHGLAVTVTACAGVVLIGWGTSLATVPVTEPTVTQEVHDDVTARIVTPDVPLTEEAPVTVDALPPVGKPVTDWTPEEDAAHDAMVYDVETAETPQDQADAAARYDVTGDTDLTGGEGRFTEPAAPDVIMEDDPAWDCRVHGNTSCGVLIEDTWYVVEFADGAPVGVRVR